MPPGLPSPMMDPPRPTPVPGGVHAAVHAAEQTPCPCCGRASRRLHRLKTRAGGPWVAACALCAGAMLERDDGAVYGGMLTRTSRRRKAG